jgi:hypothetical protein
MLRFCRKLEISFSSHHAMIPFVFLIWKQNRYVFSQLRIQHVQTFAGMYSYYCDCLKFVNCIDLPQPPGNWESVLDNEKQNMFAYVMSRGVEALDAENNTISDFIFYSFTDSKPNSVTLHKLIYPKKKGESFVLEQIKRYSHES